MPTETGVRALTLLLFAQTWGCTCIGEAERVLSEGLWQHMGQDGQPPPGLAPFEELPPLPPEARGRAQRAKLPAPGRWVRIEPGTFTMGSAEEEPGHIRWEALHEVRLTRAFYLQTTEVTQSDFKQINWRNPSGIGGCGLQCPVESISWHEAADYCNRLSKGESLAPCYACKGHSGHVRCVPKVQYDHIAECPGYRLPTEAEWEYAARAGTRSATHGGPMVIEGARNAPVLDDIAWYGGNSGVSYEPGKECSDWIERHHEADRCGPHPVSQKEANPWGLHDMLGNVREWTHDADHVYAEGAITDPIGPRLGDKRVQRGCSWTDYARTCRSAARWAVEASDRRTVVGFRVARTAPGQ